MAYCIVGNIRGIKFRGMNFAICVLVLCVCIVILTLVQSAVTHLRSAEGRKEKGGSSTSHFVCATFDQSDRTIQNQDTSIHEERIIIH